MKRLWRGLAAGPAVAATSALLSVATAACGAVERNRQAPSDSSGGTSGLGGSGAELPAAGAAARLDPGHVPVHRLSNAEYNHSVTDLLGTGLRPADAFPQVDSVPFENEASALTDISEFHAAHYFDAARALAEETFADPALKAQLLTCTPAAGDDATCAQSIIEDLGLRAWRRPLEAAELTRLVARYQHARTALEKDHEAAIAHVLRILLTSAKFLYFIEVDPDLQAAASQPRELTGYELASRLSYALWGSLPDRALLDLAESGSLADERVLSEQVDRLLDDPKGERFTRGFFGQWLGVSRLPAHGVDSRLYPEWNAALGDALLADADAFFSAFIDDRPYSELLSAPLTGGAGAAAGVYAQDPSGLRRGLLGLPAFLTVSSRADRSSAALRGKLVIERLLCTPQLVGPTCGDESQFAPDAVTPRQQLESIHKLSACAPCHTTHDPVGFALEHFDAIGRYRASYADGQAIDTSGQFLGQAFTGPEQLAALLAADQRYALCPSDRLLSFALRRTPRELDAAYVEQLSAGWSSGTLRDLVKRLISSEVFRYRKLPESEL